ncbi:hypothetical protein Tco_0949699 [Tanacetum coccineum]
MMVQNQSQMGEDKAIHKEFGDSLVRVATTASSLEAEQDSGNITKTRSKATPNESSSLRTTLGGGPKCQETMGDTTARTRFESVSKHSNDSLLARDTLNGEEVFVAGKNGNVVEEVVDAAHVSTVATTVTITTEEITLAQALEALKTSKLKVKMIVFKSQVNLQQQQFLHKNHRTRVKEMLDEETALKLQAEFDEEEILAKEKAKKEKEANIALIETWDDIQEKIDADHQLAERLQA